MDFLPERYWYDNDVKPAPNVHSARAFNILFADSTVFTNHCVDPKYMMPDYSDWRKKFLGADSTHPSYSEPRAGYTLGFY